MENICYRESRIHLVVELKEVDILGTVLMSIAAPELRVLESSWVSSKYIFFILSKCLSWTAIFCLQFIIEYLLESTLFAVYLMID